MNKLSFNEFNQKIRDGVHNLLKDKNWYRGVCTDTFKQSYQSYLNDEMTIERAIEIAELDTEYYDNYFVM